MRGARSCTCQERHAKDMLKPNMAKQFGASVLAGLVHTIFIYAYLYMLYIEALCKFSLPCFVFLSGYCGSSGKYCK